MKIYYIFGILTVFLLLALSGCRTGEVIEGNETGPTEDSTETTEEAGGDEGTINEENLSTKDLLKKLSEEAGLPTEN